MWWKDASQVPPLTAGAPRTENGGIHWLAVRWLFLFAYTCSGMAGLVYEVSWTRLLTLYIGHSTAAASAVVGAFLGGLAVGAAVGGRIAATLTPRSCLMAYIVLELGVAIAALAVPLELAAITPILRWAYTDGAGGVIFPAVRLMACLVMVFVPAAALGATFPFAVRFFSEGSEHAERQASALYFLNTAGAALGAVLAGFVLIPAIGISGTTYFGVAASVIAAASMALVSRAPHETTEAQVSERKKKKKRRAVDDDRPRSFDTLALPAIVLGLSGFAALVHEIAWTRILSLVLGPTTYAFAAALAAVISGVALGSGLGAWLVRQTRNPAAWLVFVLALAALSTSWTYAIAGGPVPIMVAREVAESANLYERLLTRGALLTVFLIVPTAMCFGAAFPLALALTPSRQDAAGRFGLVYAINTIGSVAGSLAAGFIFIPALGLQPTLWIVSACLVLAALVVMAGATVSRGTRATGLIATAATVLMIVVTPPWDRELLASGAYIYAPFVPKDLDLETQLKAGALLYYREGASATVSVKRLTGTTTLAVDGKTDASNRGDMLTQKLIAHLPLLLHDNPQNVAIIGLGSGVTAGAALTHPILRADVLEISPEVIEASRFFETENRKALEDPRTHMIVGDGRSHLLLAERKYDVIVSEPSNPWIAGVASLFTKEFFEAARDRLAPGGLMCQWANAYNISDADLRSIVATFRSVFPNGTLWLIGASDLVMVASADPLDARLQKIADHWRRSGVAADLGRVSVLDPFAILSMYVGGPREMEQYSAGATVFTDDTSRLEFTTPRELHSQSGAANGENLARLLAGTGGPDAVREARSSAGAVEWRNRGAMLVDGDVQDLAYDAYTKALTLDPGDAVALDGLVRTAVLTRRGADALAWVKSVTTGKTDRMETRIAISKLLASIGQQEEAVGAARDAVRTAPGRMEPLVQVAELHADAGNWPELETAIAALQKVAPENAATLYYEAALAFVKGDAAEAERLCRAAMETDWQFAPVYDLLGSALTKLNRLDAAREAFLKSLSFNARDSTAYTNLGIVELTAGNRDLARRYFAEALWLDPGSVMAREGLAQAR